MQQAVLEILPKLSFDAETISQLELAESTALRSPQWNELIRIPLTQRAESEWEMLKQQTEQIGQECGLPACTLQLLYLCFQLPELKENYRRRGIAEEFFWDAAGDLTSKLAECRERCGAVGTASFLWHIPFFYFQRFTLGRLTYEDRVYKGEDYTCGNVTVREGDVVLGLHIPSGAPFDRERRMDSYHKAFAFYGCSREKPLVVHGSSWLLSPDHEKMLSPQSNIVDFIHDFDMLGSVEKVGFPDAWRIYGTAAYGPMENWPRKNALQRGYYELMASGQKAKGGFGMLVFDGEKLLTGRGREET